MNISVFDDTLTFGRDLKVSVIRTSRVPSNGRVYPQPEHAGKFVVRTATNYRGRVPADWVATNAMFVPAYPMEGFWLEFEARTPHAVQLERGRINAISGNPIPEAIGQNPQNYVVSPPQRWLDGMVHPDGTVSQFVVDFDHNRDGSDLRIIAFPPRRESNAALHRVSESALNTISEQQTADVGGRIAQTVLPDPFGLPSWDTSDSASVLMHFVSIEEFVTITGEQPPDPPPAAPIRAA